MKRAAELRAAELIKKSERYIAAVRSEYIKVCDDTKKNAAYIMGELGLMSDRLSSLINLLSEKNEVFDNIEAAVEKKTASRRQAKHTEQTEQAKNTEQTEQTESEA